MDDFKLPKTEDELWAIVDKFKRNGARRRKIIIAKRIAIIICLVWLYLLIFTK